MGGRGVKGKARNAGKEAGRSDPPPELELQKRLKQGPNLLVHLGDQVDPTHICFPLERRPQEPQGCWRDTHGLHGLLPAYRAEKSSLIQPEALDPVRERSPAPNTPAQFGEIPEGPQESDLKSSQEQGGLRAAVESP